MKKIITLIVFVSIFSCESNETLVDQDNLLIGSWVEPVYEGETITFKKGTSLPNEAYGFSFRKEQNSNFVTERTSGFCGTPPLTFFDRQGTWESTGGKLKIYDINIPAVIGATPILWYNYQIVALNESKLVLKHVQSDQELDHRNLMGLFTEIENLAYSVSCTNATNWTFTAYGSKACGGPQGYIPYATQIDTVAFLQKIEKYTEQEKLYNIKWGIVSTCDLPNQPIKVVCENGLPKLKY